MTGKQLLVAEKKLTELSSIDFAFFGSQEDIFFGGFGSECGYYLLFDCIHGTTGGLVGIDNQESSLFQNLRRLVFARAHGAR